MRKESFYFFGNYILKRWWGERGMEGERGGGRKGRREKEYRLYRVIF